MAKQKKHRARRFKTEEVLMKSLKTVALEYGRTKGPVTLSRELKVPVTQVYAWANHLRKHGVKVPEISRAGIYVRTVQELLKTNPDIVDKRVKIAPI